jgi:hypothetical protein
MEWVGFYICFLLVTVVAKLWGFGRVVTMAVYDHVRLAMLVDFSLNAFIAS